MLYLVAYQYVKAGADVAAVLDTNPLMKQVMATPKLAKLPGTFAKGLYFVAWLKSRHVRMEWNVSLAGIEGDNAVTGIRWKRKGAPASAPEEVIACDAVGLGFGLRPETQLADLAGCAFEFSTLNRCWIPVRDSAGRSSVPGVYLAGDGASIAGADAAELAGRRAALALLDDAGIAGVAAHATGVMPHASSAAQIEQKLERIAIFRSGIEAAFAPPENPSRDWPDDMTVCRCEEVQAGTLRRCIRQGEASEINRLKALTRVGMGRCQGRMCGEAALALLSAETGKPIEAVGRLRSQAPVKPIPVAPWSQSACDAGVAVFAGVAGVFGEQGDE